MPALLPLLLAVLTAVTPVAPYQATTWHGRPTRYQAMGVTAAVAPGGCAAGRGADCLGTPVLQVTGAGAMPLTWRADPPVDARAFPPLRIAIGRLNRGDPHASVFVTHYEGGAHCCEQMKVAVVRGGRWRLVELGEWDTQTPDFPRDVSGDGIADLVVADDAFNYTFAAFAYSYAPPRIFNVVDGRRVDVSASPAFAPLFRRHMAVARRACEAPAGKPPNGACAAFAADAARLGRFAQAWPVVLRAYDRAQDYGPATCRRAIGRDETCMAADQIEHRHYPEALRAFLVEEGYLPRRLASDRTRT